MEVYWLKIEQNGETFMVPLALPSFFAPEQTFKGTLLKASQTSVVSEFDRKLDSAKTMAEILK